MNGYVEELRQLVGKRPLILAGACAIVTDRHGRLLLQRRTDDGLWGLPGGMMEVGETLEETARREVREETGLVVENLEFFHLFSGPEVYHQYPNGDEVYNVLASYITITFDGELMPDNDESSEVRFFHVDEIPENLSLDRIVIEKYIQTHGPGL